jgi:hypothetical protein
MARRKQKKSITTVNEIAIEAEKTKMPLMCMCLHKPNCSALVCVKINNVGIGTIIVRHNLRIYVSSTSVGVIFVLGDVLL